MGNEIDLSEFDKKIHDCIENLKEYKSFIKDNISDNRDFIYRSKEIIWSIESLQNQIKTLKYCINEKNFSYTEEEKRFYALRMIFLLRRT